MDKLFKIYKSMLDLHIGSKTTCIVFHKATEDFYSTLFDVFHQISEKNQDIEVDQPLDLEESKVSAYDLIEKAKFEIEKMIAEDNTPGMDNLLRSLYDKLEFDCGTARGFAKEAEEEEAEKTPEEEIKEEEAAPKDVKSFIKNKIIPNQ